MDFPSENCLRPYLFAGLLFCLFCACRANHEAPLPKSVDPGELPYTLEVIRQEAILAHDDYVRHKVVDLNGDGASEIVFVGWDRDISENNPNFMTIANWNLSKAGEQLNFTGAIEVDFIDIDENGAKEIFVSEQVSDTLFANIYNYKGEKLTRFRVVQREWQGDHEWSCSARPIAMLDVNRDGSKDLILRIFASYAYQPRGIYAFDGNTGRLLWRYATGASIRHVNIIDLNNDGQQEIVFGSTSPANGEGVAVNGTDDFHSYLFILNQKGENLLTRSLGEKFSTVRPHVYDFDHNGRPEILVLKTSYHYPALEKNLIGFWDFQNSRLYRKMEFERQFHEQGAVPFVDYDRDGIDEFLIVWQDGGLELRNIENEVVKTTGLGEAARPIALTGDMDADGELEIIVGGETAIYVFSCQLELLAKFEGYPLQAQLIERGQGEKKGIFLIGKYAWYQLVLSRNIASILPVKPSTFISFLTGCGMVLFIVFILQKLRQSTVISLAEKEILKHPELGIIALDQSRMIRVCTLRAREMLGLPEEIINRPLDALLVNSPGLSHLVAALKKTQTMEWGKDTFPQPCTLTHNHRELAITTGPLYDRKGRVKGTLICIADTTVSGQSQRALAWAAVAQNLAHQLKTPLSSVMLAAERLQMEYKRDTVEKANTYDRYVDYIVTEVRRLRALSDGFMKLAKLEEPAKSPANLNAIITRYLQKRKRHLPENISVHTELAAALPHVPLDENQIVIVLDILFENSLQAMDRGGKLTIATGLEQILPTQSGGDREDFACIEIADTGEGIPANELQKIFEPFYTNRQGGTGLGLTIAKKIVEDHKGTLEFTSESGIGTVASVRLRLKTDK